AARCARSTPSVRSRPTGPATTSTAAERRRSRADVGPEDARFRGSAVAAIDARHARATVGNEAATVAGQGVAAGGEQGRHGRAAPLAGLAPGLAEVVDALRQRGAGRIPRIGAVHDTLSGRMRGSGSAESPPGFDLNPVGGPP